MTDTNDEPGITLACCGLIGTLVADEGVVERSFAWLGRYRRNSRDYEWHTYSSESMLKISSIHRMLRVLKPDKTKKGAPFKYRELQGNITG